MYEQEKPVEEEDEFTIQNVPIKLQGEQENKFISVKFTIQNVPIKSYLPQTTYTVYHFS